MLPDKIPIILTRRELGEVTKAVHRYVSTPRLYPISLEQDYQYDDMRQLYIRLFQTVLRWQGNGKRQGKLSLPRLSARTLYLVLIEDENYTEELILALAQLDKALKNYSHLIILSDERRKIY